MSVTLAARDIATFRVERLKRLFTHEDFFHVHKVLGLLSLVHYGMRFYEWVVYREMFVDASKLNITIWVIIHMALSATSLIFKIPQNRVKGAPMIWPEFRAHSIIFAFRSLIAMLAIVYFGDYKYESTIRSLIVITTLLTADTATAYYKKLDNKLGTTMRGMPFPEFSAKIMSVLNLYYSFSQVLATLVVLYVPDVGSVFITVFPIQIAALLMTLVRKGVITGAGWHFYYASALGLNYAYGLTCLGVCRMSIQHTIAYWLTAFIFSFARFYLNVNKYPLWIMACLCKVCLDQS